MVTTILQSMPEIATTAGAESYRAAYLKTYFSVMLGGGVTAGMVIGGRGVNGILESTQFTFGLGENV